MQFSWNCLITHTSHGTCISTYKKPYKISLNVGKYNVRPMDGMGYIFNHGAGGLVLRVGVRRSHLAMTAGRHICSYTSTEKNINEV